MTKETIWHKGAPPVTIEQMIVEGSCTAHWAMMAGYRWDAIVCGGDALNKRNAWLVARSSQGAVIKND